MFLASEGESEFLALPAIMPGVRTSPEIVNAGMARVQCQPDGPPLHIAKAAVPSMKIAMAKKADIYVLVLDREQRSESPGVVASAVGSAVTDLSIWPFDIRVVVKDRALENWLVADLDALRQQRARFSVTDAMRRQVEPDKADNINALRLLQAAANGRSYDKKTDGQNIAKRLNVDRAAAHSRSFRHFLHVLGHDTYGIQCRRPAT